MKYKYTFTVTTTVQDVYGDCVAGVLPEEELIKALLARVNQGTTKYEVIDFRVPVRGERFIMADTGRQTLCKIDVFTRGPRLILQEVPEEKVARRFIVDILEPARQIQPEEWYTLTSNESLLHPLQELARRRGSLATENIYYPVRVQEVPVNEDERQTAPAQPRC